MKKICRIKLLLDEIHSWKITLKKSISFDFLACFLRFEPWRNPSSFELCIHTCFEGGCIPNKILTSTYRTEFYDDINTLIACLICNVRTRNRFEIKSRNLVEDVTYQLNGSWGIPSVSYNFTPCQEVEKRKGQFFSMWNLVSKLWAVWRNCNLIMHNYFIF